MSNHYHHLGKLPPETISFFKEEILKRMDTLDNGHVQFDEFLNKKYLEIFSNPELKVQYWKEQQRYIQKGFVMAPGGGLRIHKDGTRCKAALNIAIQCNPGDWLRWYDEETVTKLGKETLANYGYSGSLTRHVDIDDYESIDYIEESRVSEGDVYIVNTDVYHASKCTGPSNRIILQTKFEGFPDFETLVSELTNQSFSNLINQETASI